MRDEAGRVSFVCPRTLVFGIALLALVALLGLLAAPASAVAPDTTVYRITATSYGAPPALLRQNDPVVFKAYAANLGPGTSDLYVNYSATRHLYVRRETCIVPESEARDLSSSGADTPQCEFSEVPEGDSAIVRVKGFVVGEPGQRVRITFCSLPGSSGFDANTSNDCKRIRIAISG